MNNYEKYLRKGLLSILDLLAQKSNLLSSLKEEEEKASEINATTCKAYKTAIIMFQVNVLETMSNFVGQVAVISNNMIEGTPQIQNKLADTEIDYLNEQDSFVNKKGELEVKSSMFVPILDKLIIYPKMLTKLYNLNIAIDKSGQGWFKLVGVKDKRDSLVHPKFSNDDTLDPTLLKQQFESTDVIRNEVSVTNNDLFDGEYAILWYFAYITRVFQDINFSLYPEIKVDVGRVLFLCVFQLYTVNSMSGKLTDKQLNMQYKELLKDISSIPLKDINLTGDEINLKIKIRRTQTT